MAINSHREAAALCVKRGKPADSRKLANNTYVERRGDDYAVRLHQTDIVTFRPDGSVVLNSDGWLTVTTKARMNEYGPAGLNIGSDAGTWRVYGAESVRYTDGIVLRPFPGGWRADGDAEQDRADRAADAHNKAMRRRIREYVAAFRVNVAADGSIDVGGDCWFCAMGTADGQPLGDAVGNHDHLTSHMDERYYVPSLVIIACRAAGRDPRYWSGFDRDGTLNRWGRTFVRDYLSRRLLVGVAVGHGAGPIVHSDVVAWYRATHPVADVAAAAS